MEAGKMVMKYENTIIAKDLEIKSLREEIDKQKILI
jgi:hypothetical protein